MKDGIKLEDQQTQQERDASVRDSELRVCSENVAEVSGRSAIAGAACNDGDCVDDFKRYEPGQMIDDDTEETSDTDGVGDSKGFKPHTPENTEENTVPITSFEVPLKEEMRPGRNGGRIKTGNPGNAGGGRHPKLLAEALVDHAGNFNEDYRALHRRWLDVANACLDEGLVNAADKASRRAEAIQSTCISGGLGTRVTTVLSNPEAITVFMEGVKHVFKDQPEAHLQMVEWLEEKLGG